MVHLDDYNSGAIYIVQLHKFQKERVSFDAYHQLESGLASVWMQTYSYATGKNTVYTIYGMLCRQNILLSLPQVVCLVFLPLLHALFLALCMPYSLYIHTTFHIALPHKTNIATIKQYYTVHCRCHHN